MGRWITLLGLCGWMAGVCTVEAQVALHLEDVMTTESGASFVVTGVLETPGEESFPTGAYAINLLIDNFTGSVVGPVGFEFTNLVPNMNDAGPVFGTTAHPGELSEDDVIQFVAFGPGSTISSTGTPLLRVDLMVAGGLLSDDAALDVTILPANPVDPELNFTFVGEIDLVLPQTVTIGNRPMPFDPCDVNQDGTCDVNDIDFLSAQVRLGTTDLAFDLNGDGSVSDADRVFWVHDLMNLYFGDANLDGEFNTTDLITVFQAGEFEDGVAENSGWAAGDWTGDAEFSTSDFIQAFQDGGFELGPRAAVAAVPEPTSSSAVLLGLAACWGFVRLRR